MKIDTSTTEGKDEKLASLYLARSKGKIIQHRDALGHWFDNASNLTLSYSFRIKPQTVEEAAKDYSLSKYPKCADHVDIRTDFKAGAEWQKEQGNE